MRVLAIFATLLALTYAGPSLEQRQQGKNCKEVHSPDTCGAHGLVKCDGSGSFLVCCERCY
ncbi:hypothetical protein BDV36DRAFT_291416 [Aspergillus pseudocaelatus]|uniref:Invertebrate defensins family profile domain-containing protein n=1 Tax=Aspergillus pseudocaelatus TaxID=1825620 RepID=A0ABQ6WYR2_9EURO|nr:hypothetical protein BDV36DRAFT_291416 [Aspergillus pseudocaelatus]